MSSLYRHSNQTARSGGSVQTVEVACVLVPQARESEAEPTGRLHRTGASIAVVGYAHRGGASGIQCEMLMPRSRHSPPLQLLRWMKSARVLIEKNKR